MSAILGLVLVRYAAEAVKFYGNEIIKAIQES